MGNSFRDIFGELFVQKYNGYWFLNKNSDSPSFLHYNTGGFNNKPGSANDLFETTMNYYPEPKRRNPRPPILIDRTALPKIMTNIQK